ncbi:hypothetical protein AC1031_016734 [Aphanomyces cochlioides]|nr:hypothetical protein AC1031_016734 [Aphanomyces cochlioides]
MPSDCADCRAQSQAIQALQREHDAILEEKNQWEAERVVFQAQIVALTTANEQLEASLEQRSLEVKAMAASLHSKQAMDKQDKQDDSVAALSSKIQALEEAKLHLERKVLDMEATNASVDKMILDFKAKFEAERRDYVAEINKLQANSAGSDVVRDLEHKLSILNDMRVHDKELLSDLRRQLKLKADEIDALHANELQTSAHFEAQLAAVSHENAALRSQLEQLKAPPESGGKPQKAEKRGQDAMLMDTKEEMEEQIQVAIELDVCLEECATLSFENQQLVAKLASIQAALVSVQDQHAVLYKDFFAQQKSFQARKKDLEAQLAAAHTMTEELTIKLNRYETMLQSIQVQSEWQHIAADMTRKLAAFEVNQARLARQFNILTEEKQTEYSRRIALEDELLDLDKTLKLRIQYLESWKCGAMQRMQAMQKALNQSVLKRHYDALLESLEALQESYAHHVERWNRLHASYVEAIDLPEQNAALLHENAMLKAGADAATLANLKNERIQALETTLESYAAKIKEFAATPPTIPASKEKTMAETPTQAVLEHRIAELEQCCTALEQQVEQHKAVAALAASQANTLSLRQSRRRDDLTQLEERLRELGSRSDDDAIVGQLQQKLMTIQANYHAFTDRYDKAMEMHRAAQLQVNSLTLKLDATVESHCLELEQARLVQRALEATISTLRQSDMRARIKRMEAMSKRMESLEEDVVQLHAKKRALERRVEELEAGETPKTRGSPDDLHEVQRLKHRISILEQKERLWLEQVERLNQSTAAPGDHEKLLMEKKALQAKVDQVLFEMDNLKTKMTKLMHESSAKDVQLRKLEMQRDNLVLELQLKQTALENSNSDAAAAPTSTKTPSSPSMRSKVGYYEKDHLALQEAAQATIASLKALVQDKNVRLEEYQRQLEKVREEFDAKQRAAHDDQERRNRRLYEDNHAYIAQLKDAMEKIQELEENGGGKAVVAAREMNDRLMEQLKQVHMDLELKSQIVQELQAKVEQLRQAKKIAEARCGEALEEIAALQKVNHTLVDEMEHAEKAKQQQAGQWKADLQAKDKKMALLRDAIIKLKEEFLKAQEQQAEESVREKRKQSEHHDNRMETLAEKNNQLDAKCKMLQEKLDDMTKEMDALTVKYKRALAKPKAAKETTDLKATVVDLKATIADLREELARCKAKLSTFAGQEEEIETLRGRVKALEAKNAANLTAEAPPASARSQGTNQQDSDDKANDRRRAAWEQEKKLKRRIDILSTRLEEKNAQVETLTTQCKRVTDQFNMLQVELRELKSQREVLQPLPHQRSRDDMVELDNCYRRIVELQQQVLDARQIVVAQLDVDASVEERLERETHVLELSFQVESLQMELHRVRQSGQPQHSPEIPKMDKQREATSVAALEEVIENMKRVMEKLRSENERLRKHVKPMAKTNQANKQVEQLTAALEGSKLELQQLRQEHTDLARKFRALGVKYKELKEAQKTHASYVADMERLHSLQMQEKERQLETIKHELDNRPTTPRASLSKKDDSARIIAQLEEENARLTEELSAFDLEFFEEIEDLKFKYAQAVRQKQALEKQLGRLAD